MTTHKVNIAEKLAGFTEQWAPRRIARINDYEVKAARLQGNSSGTPTRTPTSSSWWSRAP